jgi:hypothetical protein
MTRNVFQAARRVEYPMSLVSANKLHAESDEACNFVWFIIQGHDLLTFWPGWII